MGFELIFHISPKFGEMFRSHSPRPCCSARGASSDAVGPLERRLRAYDAILALVFGAFGEASPDVERLLDAAADVGACRHHRSTGAVDPVDARGALAWLFSSSSSHVNPTAA